MNNPNETVPTGRDELTKTIAAVTDRWDEPLDEVHDLPPIVNAILAAGWSRPRVVTTVEELDALPVGSVVSHDEGWGFTVAERHTSDRLWYVTGALECIGPEVLVPATVLFEGAA